MEKTKRPSVTQITRQGPSPETEFWPPHMAHMQLHSQAHTHTHMHHTCIHTYIHTDLDIYKHTFSCLKNTREYKGNQCNNLFEKPESVLEILSE